MNIYLYIILAIAILFVVYCLYKRCKTLQEELQLKKLIDLIKNHITITLYNMNQFINVSDDMKKILIECAYKYNNNDLIKIINNK